MTKRLFLLVIALFILGYCQTTPAPPAKKVVSVKKATVATSQVQKTEPQPAAQTASELTVEQVVQLIQAGLSEDLVIAKIKKNNKAFDLSTEQLLQLKKAGVSDNVIRVMMDPQTQPAVPPSPAVPLVAIPVEMPQSSTPQTTSLEPFQPTAKVPVNLLLGREVSSATAEAGEEVIFSIAEDVLYNDAVLLRKGASGIGSVSKAKKKSMLSSGNVEFNERVIVKDTHGRQLLVKLTQTDSEGLIMAGGKAVVGAAASVFRGKKDAVLPQGMVFEGVAVGQVQQEQASTASIQFPTSSQQTATSPTPTAGDIQTQQTQQSTQKIVAQRRIFITAKRFQSEEADFPDKTLLDSVSDLKGAAASRGFTVTDNETDARLMLTVLERKTEQVRPSIWKHKTERVEGILHCALWYKEGNDWKPAVKLRTQSLYWKDAAAKMIGEVDKWLNK